MFPVTSKPSLATATKTLQRFFADSPNAGDAWLEEIYVACGRNPDEAAKNKRWITNKLVALRHYGLVEPIYAYGGGGGGGVEKMHLTAKRRQGTREGGNKQDAGEKAPV